jgi:CheY-like chemotaxis protein
MYSARSLAALLLKHRDAPIPSLQGARAGVPAALEEIYERMVAKQPVARFATMANAVQALEQLKRAVDLCDERVAHGDFAQPAASPTALTIAADPTALPGSSDFAQKDTLAPGGEAPTPLDVCRLSDLRVILVEPSGFQARIARKYLRELGIENVLACRTGAEALELARREGVDLVVSSLHLPDMTGLQLAQVLHGDSCCSHMAFVLASIDCERVELNQAPDASQIVLLQKPFDLRPLAQSLAQATGRVVEGLLR